MIEIIAQVKIVSKFALIYLCTYKKMYVTVFEVFEFLNEKLWPEKTWKLSR